MNSFNDALDKLKTVLENDAALTAFCRAKWNRKQTVKRVFKKRTELNPAEFPIIMITWPSVKKAYRISGGRENTNTVRLYTGFTQIDAEKAQLELVELEEKIDDCLTANYRLNDAGGNPLVRSIHPTDSASDEGVNHPNYFQVMEMEIGHRRL